MQLRPSQLQQFNQQGFVLLKNVFNAEEVALYRNQLHALLGDSDLHNPQLMFRQEPSNTVCGTHKNPHRVWMIMDVGLANKSMFKLVTDKRIIDPISSILGPDIDMHLSTARIKPPNTAAHLSWHQDWPHENLDLPEVMTAILYLDPTSNSAGATEVVPGSHRFGLLPTDEQNDLLQQNTKFDCHPIIAKAGDVLLVHTLLIHRAGRNLTEQDRVAVLVVCKSPAAGVRKSKSWQFDDIPIRRNNIDVISHNESETYGLIKASLSMANYKL